MGGIIKGLLQGEAFDAALMQRTLQHYAQVIQPWAESVAGYMLRDTARRNELQWRKVSALIGRGLRHELANQQTGYTMQTLLRENVALITSLPTKAAQQVHELVQDNMPTGQRHTALIERIQNLGPITESRARLIARTETSRAAATLTRARAESVGSEGYIWRTMRDGDVRPSHKEMEGKYVRWGQPPTLDNMEGHAGCTPNCRCFAEIVLPGETIV